MQSFVTLIRKHIILENWLLKPEEQVVTRMARDA
jgi:hypothetical protein